MIVWLASFAQASTSETIFGPREEILVPTVAAVVAALAAAAVCAFWNAETVCEEELRRVSVSFGACLRTVEFGVINVFSDGAITPDLLTP
jgi:hypothetical protein